jgi:hypothetical protein
MKCTDNRVAILSGHYDVKVTEDRYEEVVGDNKLGLVDGTTDFLEVAKLTQQTTTVSL